jgi:glycosyltransferase involved in cell wall biosynthesis
VQHWNVRSTKRGVNYTKRVIATRAEGRSDFLRDGETGFFFSARNPADLRAKMLVLLEDSALVTRIGATARGLMETCFSIPAVHERIMRSM